MEVVGVKGVEEEVEVRDGSECDGTGWIWERSEAVWTLSRVALRVYRSWRRGEERGGVNDRGHGALSTEH